MQSGLRFVCRLHLHHNRDDEDDGPLVLVGRTITLGTSIMAHRMLPLPDGEDAFLMDVADADPTAPLVISLLESESIFSSSRSSSRRESVSAADAVVPMFVETAAAVGALNRPYFGYDFMVPDGQFVKTPQGWRLRAEVERVGFPRHWLPLVSPFLILAQQMVFCLLQEHQIQQQQAQEQQLQHERARRQAVLQRRREIYGIPDAREGFWLPEPGLEDLMAGDVEAFAQPAEPAAPVPVDVAVQPAIAWNRDLQGAWMDERSPHAILPVNSRSSNERHGYITAGAALQLLHPALAIQDRSRFLYMVHLLAELTPRMLSSRGQCVSGTTQRELLKALEQACRMFSSLSGIYRRAFFNLWDSASKTIAECNEGNVSFRTRQLQLCRDVMCSIELPCRPDQRVLFQDLPEDVVAHIVGFLKDDTDVRNLSHTCRYKYLCFAPVLHHAHARADLLRTFAARNLFGIASVSAHPRSW